METLSLAITKCPKCGNDSNMEVFGKGEASEWRCNSCGGHFKIKGEIIDLPDEPITETFARTHKNEFTYESGIIGDVYLDYTIVNKPTIIIENVSKSDIDSLFKKLVGKRQYIQFSRMKSW